ncbi:single-stranded DNA-binding protein [Chryseobacterium sp. 'Rf worker isolate 10']|uniref:single-stranded DNA-binding protein n=1 Tax=Chryseobacterium sp. 'Rf worker isolate 10' TaxID=2887348 RepID=UPI003D6F86E5
MNIIGKLTQDAQVRTTSNNRQVVSFSVSVNDSYKNKQGERIKQFTFFDCSYWLGTGITKFLSKGTLVELSGRVSANSWTGKDGNIHTGLNFHTSQIKLLGNSEKNNNTPETKELAIADKENGMGDLPF